MLKAPETYLNSILSNAEIEKDLTKINLHFILKSNKNLHFIVEEKELDVAEIISNLCQQLTALNNRFDFKVGQRVILLKQPRFVFVIDRLSPKIILRSYDANKTVNYPQNLIDYIALSNYDIQRIGIIQNRINDYIERFGAEKQSDFVNNEKLLIIANQNIFKAIPKEYPSCFVSENKNGNTEIEYNSPLLAKICFLKNINLLDSYLQKEINGDQVKFNTCIFVGSSKYENSISIIRNYYNQRKFRRIIFIGEKDNKIDLGNNQVPLRWKWTIPELNYFNNKKNLQHKPIIIHNSELEKAITDFYQAIREIESKHTIGLKSILRFIRRLYYDWNLKQETTFSKLRQIQVEFDIALKQLLIETLGNIFPDFDFDEYQKPLSAKFAEILNTVSSNNKTEKLKTYQSKIDQLVLPSFMCNVNKIELNQIFNQTQHKTSVHGTQDIGKLESMKEQSFSNPNRSYYSLTANQSKTEIVSFSKSDDTNEDKEKVISSIMEAAKLKN